MIYIRRSFKESSNPYTLIVPMDPSNAMNIGIRIRGTIKIKFKDIYLKEKLFNSNINFGAYLSNRSDSVSDLQNFGEFWREGQAWR